MGKKKYGSVHASRSGPSGNIFAIQAAALSNMQSSGATSAEVEELLMGVEASNTYEEALEVIRRFVHLHMED